MLPDSDGGTRGARNRRRRSLLTASILLTLWGCAAPVSQLTTSSSGTIWFRSRDFSGPNALVAGTAGEIVTISGDLRFPTSAAARVPAIVIMHGGGGMGQAEPYYAAEYQKLGFATFVVDSLGGRGVARGIRTLGGQSVSVVSRIADAFSALTLLASHPRIDADRIGILGLSHGGAVAIATNVEPLRRRLAVDQRFRFHIGLYPVCAFSGTGPGSLTGNPVLLLAGALDDVAPARACRELAEVARGSGAGSSITVKVYPGAPHAWDQGMALQRFLEQRNAVNCPTYYFDAAGAFFVRSNGGLTPTTDAGVLEIVRGCLGAGGTMGSVPSVTAMGLKDMHDFLTRYQIVR